MSTELNMSALTDNDRQTRRTLVRVKRILEQMLETNGAFSDGAEIIPPAPEQTDVHKSLIMAGSSDSNTPTAVAPGWSLQTPQRSELSKDDILERFEPLAKRLKCFQARAGKPGGSEPTNTEKKEINKEQKPKTPITYGVRAMAVTLIGDDEDPDRRRKKPKRKRMK